MSAFGLKNLRDGILFRENLSEKVKRLNGYA